MFIVTTIVIGAHKRLTHEYLINPIKWLLVIILKLTKKLDMCSPPEIVSERTFNWIFSSGHILLILLCSVNTDYVRGWDWGNIMGFCAN